MEFWRSCFSKYPSIFRGCSRMGVERLSLPKICHTYPTMMKLGALIPYLKKIQKIYKSHDTPSEFCWHQQFFTGNQQNCYIKKYRYRLYFDTLFLILLTFSESWKIFLINIVKTLMMSAKMATLGLLKLKVFWNKGYDVIIFAYDVISKNLPRDSNYLKGIIFKFFCFNSYEN